MSHTGVDITDKKKQKSQAKVWSKTDTDGQTQSSEGRKRDTQTGWLADRQTDGQTDRDRQESSKRRQAAIRGN